MFFAIKKFILDLVFPVCCTGCGQEGEWFCKNCAGAIRLNEVQFCPVCWRESPEGKVCENCDSPLTGLRAAASYKKNPELAKAVKTFKYKFSENLARNLGGLLIHDFFLDLDAVIVPIPLHKKRLRWRGFNQAELLAREVGKNLDLPVTSLLKRVKNTSQQAKLSRQERLQNLTQAFEFDSDIDLAGKTVILVDDIASTGTTLIEAAKVLRAAGAAQVWGLVLARG